MTLSELQSKDVVNTLDGRCIGKPMDLEFDPMDGRVTAMVVPGEFNLWDMLRGGKVRHCHSVGKHLQDWGRCDPRGHDGDLLIDAV